MGRAPCCDKASVKKGPWTPEEDFQLKDYIEKYGTGGNWITLPQKIGLKRCGKSCRLRWLNYLRPNIKHGGFSEEEDNIICSLYISIGSRWSLIASHLPGRTDNDIKNYWNTRLKKKLLGNGKDHRTRRLAAAKQEGKDLRSYATSEGNTSPNTYWPQQQPEGVDNHLNVDYMNVPYSDFCPGIISQLFEQTCVSTNTESSSSSEPVIFQPNRQQVQLDMEVSDSNSCPRKLLQRLEGTPVDNCSNNCLTMISTSSPLRASNCINDSEIMQSLAHNLYNSSEISYEIAASPVVMDGWHMDNHTKLENPSAALAQNDNSPSFSASRSCDVGNYESPWMDILNAVNNNFGASGFPTEFNDLLLCNNMLPGQQREACNYACDPISKLEDQSAY